MDYSHDADTSQQGRRSQDFVYYSVPMKAGTRSVLVDPEAIQNHHETVAEKKESQRSWGVA